MGASGGHEIGMIEQVVLDPVEQAIAREASAARAKRFMQEDNQWLGACGEVAVRKYLSLPIELHTGADAGVDLRLDRATVDVKATKSHGRYLVFGHNGEFAADLAVLALVGSGVVDLAGWVTRTGFRREAFDHNLGRGPVRVMRHSELRPMNQLLRRWERYRAA